MEFIKPIVRRRGGNHHVAGIGSLIINKGYLRIRINVPNARLKDIGLIKGGIGVVLEESKNRKMKYVQNTIMYGEDDIPVELRGKGYKFRIKAEKVSDMEFAFYFKKAEMRNKK